MILTTVEMGNIEITIEGDDSGAWQVFIKNPDDDEPLLLFAIRTGSEKENGDFINDLAKALIESVNNIEENDMRIRDKLRELQELCEEKGCEIEVRKDGLTVSVPDGDSGNFTSQNHALTEDGINLAIAFVKGEEAPFPNASTVSLSTDGGETEAFSGTVESETPPEAE